MPAALPRVALMSALVWAGPAVARQTDLTAPPSTAGAGVATPRASSHPAHHATRAHVPAGASVRHPTHVRKEAHAPAHGRTTERRAQTTVHRATASRGAVRKTATAAAAGIAAGGAVTAMKQAAPVVPAKQPVGAVTGLPLPRFAALRSDDVNLRSGPGTRYPILWVYKRRDLPVRVDREFDVWRLIEDQDGTKGWVNQATLIGTRTFITVAPAVSAPTADTNSGGVAAGADGGSAIRAQPAGDAAALAVVKPGVTGRIMACGHAATWCRVQVRGVSGFLRRDAMWGMLPDEDVAPPG